MSEKFSLKWNDYQSNWNKSLHELRKDTDFADVTLISDDKVKFYAHKIILSSCSKVFKFILNDNVKANPLMYLSGVNSLNLGFILDYIYYGEVNIYQDELDSFLETAKKLEIEGLLAGTEDNDETLNDHELMNQLLEAKCENIAQVEDKSLATMKNEVNKIRRPYARAPKGAAKIDVGSLTKEEIDEKMKELYERTNEGWKCLVCSHTNEGSVSSNIRKHVETHLEGLVYSCNLCAKEFRLRNSLNNHKFYTHK